MRSAPEGVYSAHGGRTHPPPTRIDTRHCVGYPGTVEASGIVGAELIQSDFSFFGAGAVEAAEDFGYL